MKKNFLILLCLCSFFSFFGLNAGECAIKATSHTFFYVRPQFQTGSPERTSIFRDKIDARCDGYHGVVQVVPFGGVSGAKAAVAQYFMPFGKCALDVASIEYGNKKFPPDLMAQQFGIYPAEGQTFKSIISMAPRQSIVGVGLDYKQAFWQLPDSDNYVWFEVSSPIVQVKNKICLKETFDPNNRLIDDENLPQNMTQALQQQSWLYGKIADNNCMKKTGLADIEIKFGYEWLKSGCCFWESYIGGLIPTGNCPKAHYVFEPIIGHNKHMGLLFGSTGIFEFWHCKPCCVFSFVLDINALYLADRIEKRSFDLKYRPWSRYMQVYANKEQAELAFEQESLTLHTPGINVFTQDVCVSPRMAKTVNAAFIATRCQFYGEIGYNFYAHDAEVVELAHCWQEGPALKEIWRGNGYTNPYQTINWYIQSNEQKNIQGKNAQGYGNNLIRAGDLDLESAAHPAVMTQTLYGTLGWCSEDREYPLFVGVGGSYEFCYDNVGLNRWLTWGKFGISF